jgi:hypothetical protein
MQAIAFIRQSPGSEVSCAASPSPSPSKALYKMWVKNQKSLKVGDRKNSLVPWSTTSRAAQPQASGSGARLK